MADCPHTKVSLVRTGNGNFTRCNACGKDYAWERKEEQ